MADDKMISEMVAEMTQAAGTDPIQDEIRESKRNSAVMESFGYRLFNKFSLNKSYRRAKELMWLEDLRQFKGLYDPTVKIDPENSHVYPKLTRSKTNTVLSRLHEMLFPDLDRNWELNPTPEPDVDQATIREIVVSLIQPAPIDPQTGQIAIDPQTGQPAQPIIPTPDQVYEAILKYVKDRAAKMQSVMDDQLEEMRYPEETKKVLRSGLMYGTGVMAGPLNTKIPGKRWIVDSKVGEYVQQNYEKDAPDIRFVRIWDWYPDMTTEEIAQAEGFFERSVQTKHDLRRLAKRSDFYGDIILQYLTDHPDGDYVPEQWEVDLQTIEVEAGTTEDGATFLPNDTTNRASQRQHGKKYILLSYWGYVDGSDLESCGVTNIDGTPIDVSLEYACNVWLLGKSIVKAILFDGALNHYKVFYYEKDESSIFGEGLPRVMRHSQIAISASARMVLDNGACVAGPQVEVNWDLMQEGTDMNSIYPRKIWYRKGRGIEAQYPALRSVNFDSHIDELKGITAFFMEFADQETCLPTWMIGQQVNNENAKQTSGRQYTITVTIKDVVKNFDTFTEAIMRDLYAWNMEFNPREDIKGDFKCKPRGVSSLVMKEIYMAALNNLKQTMQPEDWAYIPRRDLLEELVKAHDLKIKVRSDQEAAEYMASISDERAKQLAYAQMEADIAYKRAQTAGQLTKAKKFNVEAEKDAITPPESGEYTDPRMTEAEIAEQNLKNASINEQMRRDEEAHRLNMFHSDEDHRVKITTAAMKTASEIDNKDKMVEHSMKMKEKQAKSNQNAQKTAKKEK